MFALIWSAHTETPRACGLGLESDGSSDDIVRAYIAESKMESVHAGL